MFVIMQSLYNLGDQFNGNVVNTLSAALERSGVAITVTSLTDVLAFGVGATTVSIYVICRRQNGKRQIPRRQICRQQIPRQQTANENHHILAIKGGFTMIKTPSPLHKKFSMQDSCSKSLL